MQIEYWFALRCSMRALGRGLAPKLRACARIGAGGARGKFTHKRAYFPVWPMSAYFPSFSYLFNITIHILAEPPSPLSVWTSYMYGPLCAIE